MAVSYNISRIDELAFNLSFTSDQTPPVDFRIYREGVLLQAFTSSTGSGNIVLTIGDGESPFVEVLDRDCQIPSIAFPGKLTLNWLSISGASYYLVQEYSGSVWNALQTILDDGGGAFAYLTSWLDDMTTYQFQVVPTDSAGNQGTAISFSPTMIRHPDSPNLAFTYATGVVSISG